MQKWNASNWFLEFWETRYASNRRLTSNNKMIIHVNEQVQLRKLNWINIEFIFQIIFHGLGFQRIGQEIDVLGSCSFSFGPLNLLPLFCFRGIFCMICNRLCWWQPRLKSTIPNKLQKMSQSYWSKLLWLGSDYIACGIAIFVLRYHRVEQRKLWFPTK